MRGMYADRCAASLGITHVFTVSRRLLSVTDVYQYLRSWADLLYYILVWNLLQSNSICFVVYDLK